MNRWNLAVLVGLLLGASTASANYPGGHPWQNRGGYGQPCPPGQGQGQGGGGQPGVLGPWYLYYPYEAHFVTPAHPQFPFWPSPQTLHGGRPDVVAPMYAIPSYWK